MEVGECYFVDFTKSVIFLVLLSSCAHKLVAARAYSSFSAGEEHGVGGQGSSGCSSLRY